LETLLEHAAQHIAVCFQYPDLSSSCFPQCPPSRLAPGLASGEQLLFPGLFQLLGHRLCLLKRLPCLACKAGDLGCKEVAGERAPLPSASCASPSTVAIHPATECE